MNLRKPLRLTLRFHIFFFHDGVERPIQRPKDVAAQQAYYSGKKKQHTVKNNILIKVSDSKVVFLTPSYEGRIHDKRKEEEVHLNAYEDIHEARSRIGHFITQVYNQKRPHSALGYLTPMEFQQKNLS